MASEPQSTNAPTGPVILLLSLEKESFWDEQFSSLVDTLSSKATIKRAAKADAAMRYLATNKPTSIIVTDGALTKRSKRSLDTVRSKLVEYVRTQGGTVVLATHFSSFVSPSDLDGWFSSSWGLPWEFGDYHRTTVDLNASSAMVAAFATSLPQSYSQKAVFLQNVGNDAAVYRPSSGQQVPIAMAKVGEGWLGYIGDVNNEVESQVVLLTMLGL